MEDICQNLVKMSEQVLVPMIGTDNIENKERAKDSLEKARLAHEKYLIGQRNNDLQEAMEHYVDAVKYDPTIPETYYNMEGMSGTDDILNMIN